jgi:exosome complex RNA-binding protein Rrp4
MSSDSLVPGQPVPLPRGPALQLGSGVYVRNGETRASLFGTPQHQGSVGLSPLCASFDLNNYSAHIGF